MRARYVEHFSFVLSTGLSHSKTTFNPKQHKAITAALRFPREEPSQRSQTPLNKDSVTRPEKEKGTGRVDRVKPGFVASASQVSENRGRGTHSGE